MFGIILWKITDLTSSTAGQFFYILLLVVLISFLAYYSTKLLASSRNIGRTGARRNICIIESMGVGMNAMIQVVSIGEKYFLIGVTKERVTMLTELDPSQIKLQNKNMIADLPFAKVFEKFMRREANDQSDGTQDDDM